MGPSIRNKLLSVILSSVFVFGVMVVIVDEGPMEMPYYDADWAEPITSPQLSAVSYSDDFEEPNISNLPQEYSPNSSVNGQDYNGSSNYAQ